MRALPYLLALATVGCGDDPLAPSPTPSVPPTPQPACYVVAPPSPNAGQILLLEDGSGIVIPGQAYALLIVPCE